jgi:large repetitive protein
MISVEAASSPVRAVVCVLTAGLLCVPVAKAAAQPGTDVAVEVTTVLTLTGLAPGFALAGEPGSVVTGDPVAMNVATNNLAGYVVTIQSRTPTMVAATRGNEDSIPIGAVSVRDSGTQPFAPLSDTTPVTVHRNAGPTDEGGDDIGNEFRADLPHVEDDTYLATLDYVAATL